MSLKSDLNGTFTLEQIDRITTEVRRVFGPSDVRANYPGCCSVLVEGWPDRQSYRNDLLVDTLAQFADGHGTTEAGDSEICSALESSGAWIDEV